MPWRKPSAEPNGLSPLTLQFGRLTNSRRSDGDPAQFWVRRIRIQVTALRQVEQGGKRSPFESAIWVGWQVRDCQSPDCGHGCPVTPLIAASLWKEACDENEKPIPYTYQPVWVLRYSPSPQAVMEWANGR